MTDVPGVKIAADAPGAPAGRKGVLQFLLYALVGAVGTLAHYAVLISTVSLHLLGPVAASVTGAIVGAIVNYFLNVRYTFRSASNGPAMVKFAITAALGALLNGLLMKLQIDAFGLHYLVAQLIATVVVLLLTYTINLLWTFRHPKAA
ncbi:MAG: GtrA family protein [Duganella sp.]